MLTSKQEVTKVVSLEEMEKTFQLYPFNLKIPRKPANFSNLFFCIQANSVDPDQTAPRGAV